MHWAVAQADDLLPDGKRVSWASAIPYGTVKAGAVNRWAESKGGNWPIHCAGLMLRASALRAVGGWVGLPSDEDLGMFAALSEIADGYNVDKVTWLYRQHPGQTTKSGGTGHLSEATRRLALQRALAVRSTGLSFTDPSSWTEVDYSLDVAPATKKQGNHPVTE